MAGRAGKASLYRDGAEWRVWIPPTQPEHYDCFGSEFAEKCAREGHPECALANEAGVSYWTKWSDALAFLLTYAGVR